jgi:hypothetical protein
MKKYPSSSAMQRALPGVVLLISLAFSTAAFAQQTGEGPSLEETITYINSHSTQFRGTGANDRDVTTTKVSVSFETSRLIIEDDQIGKRESHTSTTYYSIPFSYASKMKASAFVNLDGSGYVVLTCPDDSNHLVSRCVHRQEPAATYEDGDVGGPNFDGPDQCSRLIRAVSRLLALLDQRWQEQIRQKVDPNDPFK